MSRFFIPPENITDDRAFLEGSDAHHLLRVLRVKKGEAIDIGSMGRLYTGTIAAVTDDKIELLLAEVEREMEPPLDVYLLLGLTKGEKMDLVVEKATELGVFGIIPVSCQRSVVKLDEKQARKKTERWQRVAEAAAKQCRRARIPQIFPVCALKEALEILPDECRLLVPWEEDTEHSFAAALRQANPSSAALLIGPEGGLTECEVNLLTEKGGVSITLGPRILRSETAAIAALSILMYQWGDMGSQNNAKSGNDNGE